MEPAIVVAIAALIVSLINSAFTAKTYHRPNDEFDPAWRGDNLADDAALAYALGRQLADSARWPEWKAGAEFKAARDATAAERR